MYGDAGVDAAAGSALMLASGVGVCGMRPGVPAALPACHSWLNLMSVSL